VPVTSLLQSFPGVGQDHDFIRGGAGVLDSLQKMVACAPVCLKFLHIQSIAAGQTSKLVEVHSILANFL